MTVSPKVAIIGYGYVGQAMQRVFPDAVIFDEPKGMGSREAVNRCDVGIICVPTPAARDGSCDISIVEGVVQWLQTPLVIIKSTISPGTTDRLRETYKKRIVFVPEFIGEGKYFVPYWKYPHPTDMRYHNFLIVSGPAEDTREIVDLFLPIFGPDRIYRQVPAKLAELMKYMENAWAAMKVTFCNEFYDMAEAMGLDYRELRELWLLDSRVERMHTAVFPQKRGFGGKCFPKDVAAVIHASRSHGYEPKLLEAMVEANNRFATAHHSQILENIRIR